MFLQTPKQSQLKYQCQCSHVNIKVWVTTGFLFYCLVLEHSSHFQRSWCYPASQLFTPFAKAFSFCSSLHYQMGKQVYHVYGERRCMLFCWLPEQTWYRRILQSIPFGWKPGSMRTDPQEPWSQPLWYLQAKLPFPPTDIIQRPCSKWLREKTPPSPGCKLAGISIKVLLFKSSALHRAYYMIFFSFISGLLISLKWFRLLLLSVYMREYFKLTRVYSRPWALYSCLLKGYLSLFQDKCRK